MEECYWECEHCGQLFDTKRDCEKHEKEHEVEYTDKWECEKCGAEFGTKRASVNHEKSCEGSHRKTSKTKIWVIITIVVLIILYLLFRFGGSGELCGTHTETYTSSAKGCDNSPNCECLHKSWGGLGACDSCECTRLVSNC